MKKIDYNGKKLETVSKMKKCFLLFAEIIFFIQLFQMNASAKESDLESFFENSSKERLPQTIVGRVVTDFLQKPLPEGKVEKKVIVMGFDGFREDGLENILEDSSSSIRMVANEGGLYHTYAGGEKNFVQETTTGPGWASILSGEWSNVTGVKTCADTKQDGVNTFLMEAAKKGIPSSFVASWKEHFSVTYKNDILHVDQYNLPLQFVQTDNDEETYEWVLNQVSKREGTKTYEKQEADVIFFTLEVTDAIGHQTGYGNENPAYRDACFIADTCGRNILWEIQNRDTYEQEDWLILITTDHGGVGTTHGGQTEQEKYTWMACNHKL